MRATLPPGYASLTSRLRVAGEGHHACPNLHEAVGGERVRRLSGEGGAAPGPFGDERKRLGTPLAERSFEAALLAERLVAVPTGGAALGERAGVAAWDACEAHGGAEIHQRVCGSRPEGASRPVE